MDNARIARLDGLAASYTGQAVKLLVDCFYPMFKGISKDQDVLCRLFAPCIQKDSFYIMMENDHIMGMIGISGFQKRAIVVKEEVCTSIFGTIKGKVLAWQLRKMLSVPAVSGQEDGYIDFLATAPECRRKGVAARLLAFAESDTTFTSLSLDVLASNTGAVSLYEKQGYTKRSVKQDLWMRLAGIGKMYIMKKKRDNRSGAPGAAL